MATLSIELRHWRRCTATGDELSITVVFVVAAFVQTELELELELKLQLWHAPVATLQRAQDLPRTLPTIPPSEHCHAFPSIATVFRFPLENVAGGACRPRPVSNIVRIWQTDLVNKSKGENGLGAWELTHNGTGSPGLQVWGSKCGSRCSSSSSFIVVSETAMTYTFSALPIRKHNWGDCQNWMPHAFTPFQHGEVHASGERGKKILTSPPGSSLRPPQASTVGELSSYGGGGACIIHGRVRIKRKAVTGTLFNLVWGSQDNRTDWKLYVRSEIPLASSLPKSNKSIKIRVRNESSVS